MRIDEIEILEPPYKPTEGLALAIVIATFEVCVILGLWWVNT